MLTEALGVRFCVDDHGRRQIAGVGADLQARASRRRRQLRHQAPGEAQPGLKPYGAGDETTECPDPENRDAALQGWIREHHNDLGQALAAVHAAAASDDAQPSPPSAEPGWIEAAVATALAHGPSPAGVRRDLTLGQRIEIAETALGPAGDLGVPAARRPYLVEQAVAAVAGSAVERSY